MINIQFCHDCSYDLSDKNLNLFWKKICIDSVIKGTKWRNFSLWMIGAIEEINLLEKRHFVITHETNEEIFVRATEIYVDEIGKVFVCKDKYSHLRQLKLKIF